MSSQPAFEGMLDTPSRLVVISTVDDETILKLPVPKAKMRVKIWTNHASEPDKVIVGFW